MMRHTTHSTALYGPFASAAMLSALDGSFLFSQEWATQERAKHNRPAGTLDHRAADNDAIR